jgi:hypothetical protein
MHFSAGIPPRLVPTCLIWGAISCVSVALRAGADAGGTSPKII